MTFQLDHRLENDSLWVAEIAGFELRLMNDSRYFWVLVIPQLPDISELDELPVVMQEKLLQLAAHLSKSMKGEIKADKMNIAAIGNVVAQFHLHIVARHQGDPAWPAPIWGHSPAVPYDRVSCETRMASLRKMIDDLV